MKPVNMIGNKTILENVFLQDLNQYINDYIITRGWYIIDRNIAQRRKNGPNHVTPGWLNNMCARPGSILGLYMSVCINIAWRSFHSEVFSFYYLIISIISAMFFLSSVNIYINSASIVIFLLGISNVRCGKDNSVCMFFHLSIYSPNKQSTCALYKCSITN
jgi:hypothetical protein